MTTLVTSNEEINYITKIVKSGFLLKCISKKIANEVKQRK